MRIASFFNQNYHFMSTTTSPIGSEDLKLK